MVSIKLCELEVTANSFTYTIGDPAVLQDYQISVSESCNQFGMDVDIAGLPNFMSNDVSNYAISVAQTDETEFSG